MESISTKESECFNYQREGSTATLRRLVPGENYLKLVSQREFSKNSPRILERMFKIRIVNLHHIFLNSQSTHLILN